MLQSVAVCCSVLQCVAVCHSVLQYLLEEVRVIVVNPWDPSVWLPEESDCAQ